MKKNCLFWRYIQTTGKNIHSVSLAAIVNMIQALLHARKKLFGASSEQTQVDGQMNFFDSVQELASELFKEQQKIKVKSYEKAPRKPGVRAEMLEDIPKERSLRILAVLQ